MKSQKGNRAKIIFVLKLLVLCAVLYWLSTLFSKDDWEALKNQPKRWGVLAVAAIIVFVAHIVSYFRWMLLIRAMEIAFTPLEAIRLGFLGNLFNTVSAGSVGGDVFKAIAVARHVPDRRPEVVASVLVDRAVGLLGLVIVAATGLLVYRQTDINETLSLIRNGALLVASIGIAGLTIVVFAGRRLPWHLLERIPLVGEGLKRMVDSGLIFDGRPFLALGILGTAISVHCLLTLATYCISLGLYSPPPDLSEHFIVVPPAMAAGALPITPGGVGLQEAAIASLFQELPSLPSGFSGVVVAAMYRLFLLLVAGIGAIFYLVGFGQVRPEELDMENPSNEST